MISHTCKPVLRRNYSGIDGQKFHCICGRAWEFVRDDGDLGSYWVPFIKPLAHDDSYREKKRKKLRFEAQRVWAE